MSDPKPIDIEKELLDFVERAIAYATSPYLWPLSPLDQAHCIRDLLSRAVTLTKHREYHAFGLSVRARVILKETEERLKRAAPAPEPEMPAPRNRRKKK